MHGKIKPDDANTEKKKKRKEKKKSLDLLFLSSPNSTYNALSRE
jgi:hypothetical protein